MRLATIIGIAIPLITVVLMTVVGMDLRVDDFRRLLGRSRLVWAGLLVPPLVLPPLALGLIALARPPLPIATGLLLIATCPVGGISNTFTYLARASTALSVTLTALSCLLAFVTVPAVGAVLGHVRQEALVTQAPAPTLVAHMLATVALPVSLGMAVHARWPEPTLRLRPSMRRLAFVLLGCLLALIILADVAAFLSALPQAVPLAAVFIVCSCLIGGVVAQAVGGERRDRVAVAIEFATRNVAVATTIAVTVLGQTDFAIFGTAYFLTEVPLMTTAAVALRPFVARESA